MASLFESVEINVPAAAAWHALRNVGGAHEMFADVLVDGSIEGDLRTVTFADGMTVDERIVGIDETLMRVAYTVLGDMFEYHAAAMQIVSAGPGRCRFQWWSDLLPQEAVEMVRPLMQQGCAAAKATLEKQ